MSAREPSERTAAPRLVVVGHGMAAHRLCHALARAGAPHAVTVVGDEAAYDRVHLSDAFAPARAGATAADCVESLALEPLPERVATLRDRVTRIDREGRRILLERGTELAYDALVLATGSAPFVPPIPGREREGVYVYRTVEDVVAIAEAAGRARRAAVIGGGLLGLEAARALLDAGLETHVIERAPRLMPRQLDGPGASVLRREVEALGVTVHTGAQVSGILGDARCEAVMLGERALPVDLVVIAAGIRPRDGLAAAAGLPLGPRGGVAVNRRLESADPTVFAVGEVAALEGRCWGLVEPAYAMADALAARLAGDASREVEARLPPTQLKLLGVDVASVGAHPEEREGAPEVVWHDVRAGVYARLVLAEDARQLVGAVLVGDVSALPRLAHYERSGELLPDDVASLVVPGERSAGDAGLPEGALVCSCNGVSRAALRDAVAGGARSMAELKDATTCGTGCGGCVPLATTLLRQDLADLGESAPTRLCPHFAHSRQDLFTIIQVRGIRDFSTLLREHGEGSEGCEICKPAVASIFASTSPAPILREHALLQDTNDRFLANIQRQGLYSVVPRVPGGEITPEKLIALGSVAARFGLYTKITGAQRVDLFGARLEQLPDIWEALVDAGFESGHAYAKALRTVKSCVGTSWCRYGVGDSTGLAIRLETRYRGLRAPHKLKGAASGCVRECAEAQSKDFGVIATEKGWNLFVGGNGGARPRHAELLASDIDEETVVRYLDRFLAYYIRSADKLTRTARWIEGLEGGIDHVREVVVEDRLGLGAELEAQMASMVEGYQCEWRAVVEDPAQRAAFRHFANSDASDDRVFTIRERDQDRPADWTERRPEKVSLPLVGSRWVDVGAPVDFPEGGSATVQIDGVQLAVHHFASRGTWYATQAMCPHRGDMVLGRGMLADVGGTPKVVCPMHKKGFALETGEEIGGEHTLATFPVRITAGRVLVEVPSSAALRSALCAGHAEAAE